MNAFEICFSQLFVQTSTHLSIVDLEVVLCLASAHSHSKIHWGAKQVSGICFNMLRMLIVHASGSQYGARAKMIGNCVSVNMKNTFKISMTPIHTDKYFLQNFVQHC